MGSLENYTGKLRGVDFFDGGGGVAAVIIGGR